MGDVVTVGGRFAYEGSAEGLLEEIDYGRVTNAAMLDPGFVGPYGVATSVGATVLAWNTSAVWSAPRKGAGRSVSAAPAR